VVVSAEANDRLALPSDRPRLVLDRIKSLAAGGLTSMHVVGDFLKRRITPLQQRACLCCWFTGTNDISRLQRGPRTGLAWEELEVLVKGITGESFVLESLILPEGIPALCDDAGLRTVILATLPTLDESGVAVRQTGGRDPHRGILNSNAPAGGPQSAGVASSAPARASRASAVAPAPWARAKGLQAAPPPRRCQSVGGREATPAAPRRRLVRFGPPPPPPLGPRRPTPRSVRGLLVGPRRPAPRPRAHRGASVLHHHNHRVCRHHNHHHRRAHRRQQHLGMISPRGTSSSSKSSGRPASRVAGRSRAPSEWSPFLFD
jgi:hypothetical protein